MQNSPGIPLAALVVAIALAIITTLSVVAGVGGGVALNELQIGLTLGQIWLLVLSVPLLVGAAMFGCSRLSHPTGAVARFDPTSED
jgi:H+/Cl- antiporter ClcA